MSFQPSKSTVKDATLVEFLYSDIKPDVQCVPGIGPAIAEFLSQAGIQNTFMLIAKFLELKTNDRDVVAHCNAFFEWLGEIGIKSNRQNITKSIAEKMSISFPTIYAESFFMELDESIAEMSC